MTGRPPAEKATAGDPAPAGAGASLPSPVATAGSPRRLYKGWAPYLFTSPYTILTALFFLVPLGNAVLLAFYQTNGPRSRVFVGLGNFRFLLADPMFHTALWNTTVFAAASLFLQLPLSLGLALLVNKGKVKGFFRLILFSPNLVGQIFVGILFSVLFTPRYGLINRGSQLLFNWGLEQRWLSTPHLVMPAIILTSLWLYVGFNMVYFLAALQAVDKTLEEAARIDGANRWQVFRHVTLPSMRHVILFVVVTCLIGSYHIFELPLALLHPSRYGPDNAGLTVIGYLNDVAFRSGDLGLGSAVGWVVSIIIFSISVIQLRITRAGQD